MALPRPDPRGIKLAVFDLDGTLVDAYPAIAESVNHMLRHMGYPPQTLAVIKRSVGWGVDGLVRTFVPEDKAVKALAIFRKHHDARLRRDLKVQSGARSLLPFLKKRGCVLAIASNRPAKFCHLILKTLGLAGLFKYVVGGDSVKRAKPHPDMLKCILKKSGIRAAQAVYVGDMTVDIACGREAGVFTFAVPTGSCTIAELKAAKPDALIRRISDVRKFFKV